MQASSNLGHAGDLESAIAKARDKLEKERIMLAKSRQIVSQMSNMNAKADAQIMVHDAEQRVSYLEAEYRRLAQKRDDKNSIKSGTGSMNDGRSSPSTVTSEKSTNRPHSMSFSKLDLRKASSHLSGQKISLKVHEIAYKLEVERKIRDNANRIRMLYSNDYQRGSKNKMTQITDSDRILHETNDRIRLLDYSLKKNQSLYVDYADDDDADTAIEDEFSQFQPAMRRPITGKLQLRIHRAKDLRRAPIHTRAFRSPQHFVVVKIDGRVCGTTPIVKDSVFNHYFEIEVKKASEVELSVFERVDKDYLVGLMWIRLSEIYEDIRKKEIVADSSSGWTTAEQMSKGAGGAHGHGSPGVPHMATGHGGQPDAAPGVLSEWDVESQGQIELWMNFTKSTAKRRAQSRLGRKAAVRKRRGPCIEMCGHHFYPLHTYSIMKCAVCSDHIVNEVGQQCDDCHLFVHQSCVGRVVANCQLSDPPEDAVELVHRIPHRFEQSTNMGANWCCHCGNMLPIGRRALKCTECSATCHAGCKDYVPTMCGLDMVKASAMLNEIKRAKGASVPQPKVLAKRDTMAKRPTADAQAADLQSRFGQMQVQASPIPERLSQVGHQRANSNEFVPIKSNPVSPTNQRPPGQMQPGQMQSGQMQSGQMQPGQPGQMPPGQMQQPGQVPPLSYYQQQLQQAKGNYMPYPQQQPIQGQPMQGQPMQGQPMQGQPMQGQPMQQPIHGQPMQQPRPNMYPSPQQQYRPPPPQSMTPQQQQYQQYQMQQQHQMQQQQMQQHHLQQMQQQQQKQQRPGAVAPPMAHDAREQIHQAMQQKQTGIPAGHQPPRKVGFENFKFVKVLGKGNFGKVMLSEEKGTGKLYAIKVLKKEFIVENDEFDSTRSEKRVLLIANQERHPFLVGLHSCFQTSNHIFFVMEYISGGDLMMHVQKKGSFGERQAKFFACEILLGLAYFHKAGIIYRDLKLDNILLDNEGHVKIADYGLCKENMGYGQTTITFCGTPEFMAPEIVLEQRYGRAVDWWAFGVLIYEMILGTSPFHGEDENEIFDSILEDEILYPVRMSRDSVFICQALLEKDPSKRLGSGPNDAEDIMKHSFFAGVNWDDVLNKKISPLYVPEIRGRFDVSNFDPEFTTEKPGLTPTNTIIDKHDQREFADFDYVSPWAGAAEKWTR
ncbi:Serine/threonine kinase [Coemansia sp. RSA 1822]|nr:Serine/threonine kinase [Coemansia sp. RSA 1822]